MCSCRRAGRPDHGLARSQCVALGARWGRGCSRLQSIGWFRSLTGRRFADPSSADATGRNHLRPPPRACRVAATPARPRRPHGSRLATLPGGWMLPRRNNARALWKFCKLLIRHMNNFRDAVRTTCSHRLATPCHPHAKGVASISQVHRISGTHLGKKAWPMSATTATEDCVPSAPRPAGRVVRCFLAVASIAKPSLSCAVVPPSSTTPARSEPYRKTCVTRRATRRRVMVGASSRLRFQPEEAV